MPPRRVSIWTDEVVAALKEHVAAGHSATVTANALTERFGVKFTKSGCVGYGYRNGIQFRSSSADEYYRKKGVSRGWWHEEAKRLEKAGVSRQGIVRALGGIKYDHLVRVLGHAERKRPPRRTFDNKKPTPPKVRVEEPTPDTAVSFEDLKPRACRWPYGTGPYRFCGCRTEPNRSYCGEHTARSVQREYLAEAA